MIRDKNLDEAEKITEKAIIKPILVKP